ncbi:unnamed protein product [Blepharisma stoltei]|uniref:Centromere/kinetochore protein zw10-like protein n=1 Tax=Blepharisma stoltei TaxID=1481888 RepID=A0AAU9IJ73_9CILI|nr:unnamed protein product [Blepharisma stoltei]
MDPAELNKLVIDVDLQKQNLIEITDPRKPEFLQSETSINEIENQIAEIELKMLELNLGDDFKPWKDLNLCKILANIHSAIESFPTVLKGSISDAIVIFNKAKEKIKCVREPDPELMQRIAEKIINWQGRLKAAVEDVWAELVKYQKDSITVFSQFNKGEKCIRTEEIIQNLIELGYIEEKMSFLINWGIDLCKRQDHLIAENIANNGVKLSSKESSKISPLFLLLNNLKEFLLFLCKNLKINEFSIDVLKFIDLIWLLKPKIEETIQELDDPSQSYQEIYEIIKDFEATISEYKIVDKSYKELSNIVQGWKAIKAKYTQTQVMGKVRELILIEDIRILEISDATERGTISSIMITSDKKKTDTHFYKLPTMHISESTKKIVEIIYKILDDSLILPESDLLKSLRLARECFMLYKALKYSTISSKSTQLLPACLFYNNCLYLIHHLILIPAHYSHHLPPNLQYAIYLADLIPIFQSEANQVFFQMKDFYREKMLNFVRKLQFHKIEANYSEMERVLNASIAVIHECCGVWREVLSKRDYFKSTGNMVDALIGYLVPLAMKLEDIVMEDTPPLKQLLWKVFELKDVFLGESPVQFSQQWERLVLLLDLLDTDLASIVVFHEQSRFKGKFSVNEVKHLVCAIFEDNENRRKCLEHLV